MNSTDNVPTWVYAARVFLFLLILAFMVWGPFSRQILHSGNNLYRPWIMFKGIAVGVVDARYYRQYPDGRRELLDRYAVLGYDDWRAAPKYVRRIEGSNAAASLGRRLCRRLAPGADVRVESRIATRKGWQVDERPDRNVCLDKRQGQ